MADRNPRLGARAYQGLRRIVLLLSCSFVVFVPMLHLLRTEAERRVAGTGTWSTLARRIPGLGALSERIEAGALVGAPWSVSLFGLELLDPLAALSLIFAGIFDLRVLLAALPTLILVLVLGRFFCGWLCPYIPILAASNAARELLTKAGLPPKDVELPKRTAFLVLLALLIISAAAGTQVAPLIYPPAIIGREVFRAVFFAGVGAGAWVVGLAFIFDTTISKAGFCRYVCPGGAVFRLLGRASPVHVVRDENACTSCTACDVVCNLGQLPMTDKLDTGCERCGKCISACPTDALRFTVGRPLPIFLGDEPAQAAEHPEVAHG